MAEFLSVRENLGENTSCTHRHLWRARCELVCVYATGAVWDVACGLLLVQGMCDAACSLVPVNEVCRESTIKSSRQPVCRESCFDFRLRTRDVRAGVCGPRAAHGRWSRDAREPGKDVNGPRVRRRASRKASGPRGATGDGGLDAATACDDLSDSPTASQWRTSSFPHVASRRRPAAVISD